MAWTTQQQAKAGRMGITLPGGNGNSATGAQAGQTPPAPSAPAQGGGAGAGAGGAGAQGGIGTLKPTGQGPQPDFAPPGAMPGGGFNPNNLPLGAMPPGTTPQNPFGGGMQGPANIGGGKMGGAWNPPGKLTAGAQMPGGMTQPQANIGTGKGIQPQQPSTNWSPDQSAPGTGFVAPIGEMGTTNAMPPPGPGLGSQISNQFNQGAANIGGSKGGGGGFAGMAPPSVAAGLTPQQPSQGPQPGMQTMSPQEYQQISDWQKTNPTQYTY